MSKALSIDFRICLVAAIDGGASHRYTTERFGASAASVSRWRNLQLRQGNVRPDRLGGDRSSHNIEAHADLIMAGLAEHRDGTLFELRSLRSAQGVNASNWALHSFGVRHEQTRKKMSGHAIEQIRPNILE